MPDPKRACDDLRKALREVAKVVTGEDNAEVFFYNETDDMVTP